MLIELPWPDARLNPNQSKGKHWAGTAALRKKARNDAIWLTRGALLQRLLIGSEKLFDDEVAVTITFVQPDKRKRDRDNLLAACKPALDGIAEALGLDDAQFEPVTLRREYGAKPGLVRVELV